MNTASYIKIETVIVETKTEITASQVVHELSMMDMMDLKREEEITERYMRLDKGKKAHDLTHYIPRYNGMEW